MMPSVAPEPTLASRGGVRGVYDAAVTQVQGEQAFVTAGRLTLVLIIVYVTDALHLSMTTRALAIVGLVFPALLRSRLYWGTMLALLVVFFAPIWFRIDNHKYLLVYWCLAMFLACCTSDPVRAAGVNGRVLIGLCFTFATLWKFISPDFTSGAFMEYTLLTDPRFTPVSSGLAGVPVPESQENWNRLVDLKRVDASADQVVLFGTATAATLGRIMAWWVIAIEALVAITWLWPRRGWVSSSRHVFLLLFVITTYPVATVEAFAMLLLAMALVQTEPERLKLRLTYLLVVAAVPLWRLL